MAEEPKKEEKIISDDLKDLVIERLDILPPDLAFFIGSEGKKFSKKELIESVRRGDEVGRQVVEMEMSFLKALKDGVLLEEILSSDQQ